MKTTELTPFLRLRTSIAAALLVAATSAARADKSDIKVFSVTDPTPPTPRLGGPTRPPAAASNGAPTTGHVVEIRFENFSGYDPQLVKILPYSTAPADHPTSPGKLYKSAACAPADLLWEDGVPSAGMTSATGPMQAYNGCGHNPTWSGGLCDQLVYCAQTPADCTASPTHLPPYQVPLRSLRLSDLHDNNDNTYSVWTNWFPNGEWYIGLPQQTATSAYTTVPDVPFYVNWPPFTYPHQCNAADPNDYSCTVMCLNGIHFTHAFFNGALHIFTPGRPTPAPSPNPWSVLPLNDCSAGTNSQCPGPGGVDWQQLELTLDANSADQADVTYIDYANVPMRLESYGSQGGTFSRLQATGFPEQASGRVHSNFRTAVTQLKSLYPANLLVSCTTQNPPEISTVLQVSGPSKVDVDCANSPLIAKFYPALDNPQAPYVCSNPLLNGTYNTFRNAFDAMSQRSYTFPNGSSGCGWIRDWIQVATLEGPNRVFDYDFVLNVTKETATSATTYTATLKGKATVRKLEQGPNSPPDNHPDSYRDFDDLTIVLGKDVYYSDNSPPILDLTKAIYLALTPANLPTSINNPSQSCPQSFATPSLMGPGDTSAGDLRLSASWVAAMSYLDSTCTPNPQAFFGPAANKTVISSIGRVMGDAYAGFALGFLTTTDTNPIIPATTTGGSAFQWPTFNTAAPFNQPTTWPNSPNFQCVDCVYDSTNGMPFWKTSSGSWWGGGSFKTNGGGTQYWSNNCWNTQKIFSKHYLAGLGQQSGYGGLLYPLLDAGYVHPFDDRMQNYDAAIQCYEYGSVDVTQLRVKFWAGISYTSLNLSRYDIGGDGWVDGDDLSHLLSEWGSCTQVPGGCRSDFDGNGVVDAEDLAKLLASWSPVP